MYKKRIRRWRRERVEALDLTFIRLIDLVKKNLKETKIRSMEFIYTAWQAILVSKL